MIININDLTSLAIMQGDTYFYELEFDYFQERNLYYYGYIFRQ